MSITRRDVLVGLAATCALPSSLFGTDSNSTEVPTMPNDLPPIDQNLPKILATATFATG